MTQAPTDSAAAHDVGAELRAKVQMNRSRVGRWLWLVVALVLASGLGFGVWKWREAAARARAPSFQTEVAQRGELQATVTATGTVGGRDTVDVGAEVTGTIREIYVDFNDRVKAGDVLLEINPEVLKANQQSADARLSAARAANSSAQATLQEAQTVLTRVQALAAKGLVATSDLDAAQASAARANAQVRSTAADILVAKASLDSAETSLRKATIRAPIDGVVLSRSVEVGQTVTASLQTPVLFRLARDLTKMELSVQIDEADIGRVKEGQVATFSVDAYPRRRFSAVLRSLRNLPTTTDNVVTYQAVLDVPNDDLALRPGLTATATIVTDAVQDAVLVPNAALRFTPPKEKAGAARPASPFRMFGGPGGRRPDGPRPSANAAVAPVAENSGTVWLLKGGVPEPVSVTLGVSDGSLTEVKAGLGPGENVIVDSLLSEGK